MSTLTGVYALRNVDKILGLGCEFTPPLRAVNRANPNYKAPEPLARLVSSHRHDHCLF